MIDTPQLDHMSYIKSHGGYYWTTDQARKGNLTVTSATMRDYGYSLKHKPTGATAMWFKRKRDALAKIAALANCPNTPRITGA